MGEEKKNPHAIALSKLGAKKGGAARATALSPERKREIAQRAARARWAKTKKKTGMPTDPPKGFNCSCRQAPPGCVSWRVRLIAVALVTHSCLYSTIFVPPLYLDTSAVSKSEIDWKAVGRRIRVLRGFEISQAQFALELGVCQRQLSRYEWGRSEIGAMMLLRLARKSGKTMEWFLAGKNRVP